MAFFSWSNSYSVNIKELDGHHQKLVQMVNNLYEAMASGKAQDVSGKILEELITYTKNHFAAEERLMQKYEYPDMAAHVKEHQALTAKALDLQQKQKSGKLTLSLELGNFLKDWLTNHIQGVDKKYSAFFNSKGVA